MENGGVALPNGPAFLARLLHSDRERTGLIHTVTCNLFQKAVMHAFSLPGHVGLSFNLSANDITSPAKVGFLVEYFKMALLR